MATIGRKASGAQAYALDYLEGKGERGATRAELLEMGVRPNTIHALFARGWIRKTDTWTKGLKVETWHAVPESRRPR